MEISQDLGHRPIVFIRFNPDDYVDIDGKKVKSCFSTDKNGMLKLTKSKYAEWNMRIECLKSQISHWCDNPSEKTIEIINLYYDFNHLTHN